MSPAAFLQADSLWNVQGSITVVGVLLVAVFALYMGLVSPRHAVLELKTRLQEREDENAVLHAERIKDIEEKAELRGEVAALRQEVSALRQEVTMLRESRER